MSAQWDRGSLRVSFALGPEHLLEIGFGLVAVVLGAAQAWACRFQPSTVDLVSYLDVADAYVQGHWSDAINGYWNPLYSWILGVTFALARPSLELEYPLAKLVDFAVFLICLASFSWFLTSLRTAYRNALVARADTGLAIPDWAWIVAGYTLFIWSSLKWITLTSSTPDMCGAALAYCAWALLFRIEWDGRRINYLLLGMVLALGYFARTPMFIVGWSVLLLLGVQAATNERRRRAIAAGVVFLVLMAPFIVSISRARHHLTIGDNWSLNHAWLASPGSYIIPNRHWQGGPPGFGSPKHPSRMLWNAPPTFEFETPVGGTYPPWTDPSYWYEGLRYHFDGAAEWISLKHNLQFYYRFFGGWLLLVLALALAAFGHVRSTLAALRRNTRYWAPPAVGLAIFLFANDLLVQWTRTPQPPTRYVAVFIVLFSLTMAASLRVRYAALPRSFERLLAAALVVMSLAVLAFLTRDTVRTLEQPRPLLPWQLARGLEDSGIAPGMRVAIVGSSSDHEFWARLARVRIVADVPNETSFWSKSPEVQQVVLRLLARTGAQLVVAPWIPVSAHARGWRLAGDTNYGLLDLRQIDLEAGEPLLTSR
jgi:hypothetical protein